MSNSVPSLPADAVEFLDPEPEPLWTLAYVSEPTRALSDAEMRGLHLTAQRNNELDDLTGRLVVIESASRPTRFVQYLEGPRLALKACARRIFADGRHSHIVVFQNTKLDRRRFGQWSMQYEVVDSSHLDADVATALSRIREQATVDRVEEVEPVSILV